VIGTYGMNKINYIILLLLSFILSTAYSRGQNEDTFLHSSPRHHTGSDKGHSEHHRNQTFMHTAPGKVGTHNQNGASQSTDTFMHNFNEKQGTNMQGGSSQSTDTFLHNPNGLQTGTENTR
jgi:hypothetical protein